MARVQLTCGCGWVFFVSDATGGSVKCPSCGDDVRIPGGKKTGRKMAADIAREKQGQRNLVLLAGAAVLGGLVVVGGILLLMNSGGGKPQGGGRTWEDLTGGPRADGQPRSGDSSGKGNPLGGPGPGPITPAGPYIPPPAVDPGARIDWEQRQARAAYKLNVAGITCELLRARGSKELTDQLEEAMMKYLRDLNEATDKLREERGGCIVPGHLLAGDRIIFFDGAALGTMSAKDKDKFLSDWLKNKLQAGVMAQLSVRRDDQDIAVIMNFNECSKELRIITKLADVDLPDGAFGEVKPPPPKIRERAPIPADVAADVRSKLSSVHPYYLLLLGDDKSRIEAMLAEGKAEPADVDWMKTRMVELASAAADEQSSFRAAIEECRTKLQQPSSVDTIVLKSGERKEGKIKRETEDEIELEMKIGAITGSRKFKKEDIREVLRGKGAATEFPVKLEQAKDAGALAALIAWCKERKLEVQRDLTCCTLLLKEPAHETARKELGFQKGSNGIWSRDVEAKRDGDKFRFDGKDYTLQEFIARLRARGYVEMAGQWCEQKDWGYRIDNLYKDDKKLRLQGDCAVMTRIVRETRSIYDPARKEYIKKTVEVEVGRFLGPPGWLSSKGRDGTATIVVEAPGEFVTCKVKAVSELTASGSVQVRVWTEDGRQKQLYSLSAVGKADDSYDITDTVRGAKRFFIEAMLNGTYLSEDLGSVMFLPCHRNSNGILDVRAKVAVPLPKINDMMRGVSPPPNPNPNPNPGTEDMQQLRVTIEAVAESVLKESDIFKDAIINVRSATSQYKYGASVDTPPDYTIVLKHMTDPTTFDPSSLKSDALLEIGGWWQKQTIAQRRAFARWFALYTAMYRFYKPK